MAGPALDSFVVKPSILSLLLPFVDIVVVAAVLMEFIAALGVIVVVLSSPRSFFLMTPVASF